MQRTAQDWLVLTQLTNHDASSVGIVMACQFGPQLLLLPVSGFAADYFDKRKLMFVTQTIMALLSLLLGVLTIQGSILLWQVYLLTFLSGCANALDGPVHHTFVGNLVEQNDLANAVALNSTSFNSARMIGPAIAGLLIGLIGTGWSFIINGISFIAVIAALAKMRPETFYEMHHPKRAKGSFTAGFRYVWRRPDLFTMMLMIFILGTFGFNFPLYISTMATKVFHTDATAFGLLSSAMAIGTVIGSLYAANQELPQMKILLYSTALFAISTAIAALSPNYLSFAIMLLIIGFATLLFNNTNNSLMQLSSDSEIRGRVIAIRMAILMGGTPVGAPITGWVIDQFGARWGLALGAAAGVAAVAVICRYFHHQTQAMSIDNSHN